MCREEWVSVTHVAVVDRSPGMAWGPRRPWWARWTLCGGKEKDLISHAPSQATDAGQDARHRRERS